LTRLAVLPLTHQPFSEHTVEAGSSEPAEYYQEAERRHRIWDLEELL